MRHLFEQTPLIVLLLNLPSFVIDINIHGNHGVITFGKRHASPSSSQHICQIVSQLLICTIMIYIIYTQMYARGFFIMEHLNSCIQRCLLFYYAKIGDVFAYATKILVLDVSLLIVGSQSS